MRSAGRVPWRAASHKDFTQRARDALCRLAPVVAELPMLNGVPVKSSWDEQLTTEMTDAGRAVHEELLLDDLIADLC